jgi:hypothetical protein
MSYSPQLTEIKTTTIVNTNGLQAFVAAVKIVKSAAVLSFFRLVSCAGYLQNQRYFFQNYNLPENIHLGI